ncbi:MAG: LamG-like jellyroll fold domain-containing protein, partial [Candidatus Neomarinimicrobiota bacterium]
NLNYISEGVPGEYTIVINVKFNSSSGSQFIFGDERDGNNGVMMQLQSNLLSTFFAPPFSYHSSDFSPTTDTDYNIVFRQNDGGMQIFVDGALRGSFSGMNHSESVHNTGLGVFGVGQFNNRQFDGVMHDCIIYSEALDDATINTQISEDAYLSSNNLYALYNFSTGSGNMVYDQSGNGHNGTLSGATWIEDDPIHTLTYVAIPDQNFEQKLIDLGYDDVLDGQVLSDNISEVEHLNVSDAEIADITGIGGFTNLKSLEIRNNSLTSLDLIAVPHLEQLWADQNNLNSINVSGNAQLTYLHIYNCVITSIDLSQNINLRNLIIDNNSIANLDLSNNSELLELRAYNNGLTEIDLTNNLQLENLSISNNPIETLDVSYLTSLKHLNIESIGLTQIDVSNNILLEFFRVGYNELTSLDISSNENLILLYVYYNSLAELDLSQNLMLSAFSAGNTGISNYDLSNNLQLTEIYLQNNGVNSIDLTLYPELAYLDLHGNELTSLDLSNNPLLHYVNLDNNQLTTLDFSERPNLRFLQCHNNNLERLNLKHGSDQFEHLNATANPDLNCIEVLDVAYHEERFTYENNSLDEGVVFSEECGPVALVNPESISEILYD